MAIDSAMDGLFSQFGPSSAVKRKISELTRPHSGLSMKRSDRMVGIDGTAQGRMKITDRALIHQRAWMKKPDSPTATSIFRFTPITRKISVLIAERKKIGSSTSSI